MLTDRDFMLLNMKCLKSVIDDGDFNSFRAAHTIWLARRNDTCVIDPGS